MTLTNRDSDNRSSNDPVINWLLDADPSIRWQAMRDLTDAPAEIAAAERSRVASEGWGSRLLDEQRPDGQWGDGVATPFWWSNMYTLVFLRDLGLDPASPRARTAIGRVRGSVTWGPEFKKSPFFEGEVEPCINGRVVALGAYFGERSDRLVDRLLGEQLADGGWNCEAERGSVRSSFHTTICVLEGLFAFERTFGATKPVTDARTRAHAAFGSEVRCRQAGWRRVAVAQQRCLAVGVEAEADRHTGVVWPAFGRQLPADARELHGLSQLLVGEFRSGLIRRLLLGAGMQGLRQRKKRREDDRPARRTRSHDRAFHFGGRLPRNASTPSLPSAVKKSEAIECPAT